MTVRFPAEWEPHEATLLTWPWDATIWGPAHAGAIAAIAHAAAALSGRERVIVHVPDQAWGDRAGTAIRDFGGRLADVEFVELPSDDVWVRDHGPTFVLDDGDLRAVDWNFNAWGGKFPHTRDALVAAAIARRMGFPCDRAGIVLEGGAVETDGRGTVLCTRTVALSPARNDGWTEARIEQELKRVTGASNVVWLDRGMAADDTDGHIDTLARFTESGRVLVHACDDVAHPDHGALSNNAAVLRSLLNTEVTSISAPTLRDDDGRLLPATYVNFYIANGVVLVPQYGCAADPTALELIGDAFPEREAVGIDCRALLTQGGAIHCATQQLPALPGRQNVGHRLAAPMTDQLCIGSGDARSRPSGATRSRTRSR